MTSRPQHIAFASAPVLVTACLRLRMPRLVSYIAAGKERSIALFLRLGGVIDPALPGDVVIRHDLRRAA